MIVRFRAPSYSYEVYEFMLRDRKLPRVGDFVVATQFGSDVPLRVTARTVDFGDDTVVLDLGD